MNFKEFLHIYAFGCTGYMFIEILWRGHTHWSMGVVGGICFVAMYIIDIVKKEAHILLKAFYSAICVTAVELLSGLIINKLFGLAVWDYSNMKFNLLGQISLLYSILWFFLCIPALIMCRILRHRVFGALPQSNRHLTKIFERQPTLRQRER